MADLIHIDCPTQLFHPDASPPREGDEWAAGHDIRCVAGTEGIWGKLLDPDFATHWEKWIEFEARGHVELNPGDSFLFRTGFAQAIEPGYACFLWDRSGMGGIKKIHRTAGVIDCSYRGEWLVSLVNHDRKPHVIEVGDKIVQGVYDRIVRARCPIVPSLDKTSRGDGGFGSTGN